MTLHINRFVDAIKAHEARNARDFIMSMRDAKDLHADITKLLNTLVALQESLRTVDKQEIIQVKVEGGRF
jgi:hypothetical protein